MSNTTKPTSGAIAWLKEHGYVRCVIEYSGGGDEGGADTVTCYLADGTTVDGPSWDDEGHDLLIAPLDYQYGSWAGEFSAYGTLVYDVLAGTCVMNDNIMEEYESSTYKF